ncbi:MAG: hypothetical protein JWO33_730 [Caulobacteraceae bacterium]|nr:hypothetical protein [Caulobacteraceae bacterium]
MTDAAAARPRAAFKLLPIPNRWLVVALVIFMQAFTMGTFTYTFSFWVQPWTQAFDATKTDVMVIASVRIYAVAIGSFLLAKYLDKLPQRLVATVGVLAYAGGMLIAAAAPSLMAIMGVYVIFVPLAMTLAGPIAAITFVSRAFEKNRGLAIGIATMGSSVGGALIPNLTARLLESGDWRQAHLVLGLSSLLVLPLIWLILRKPQVAASAAVARGPTPAKAPDMTTLQMLRSVDFWLCSVAFMAGFSVFVLIQFNIAPFAADVGVSLKSAALFVTAFTLGMLGGRLAVGYLTDRMDTRYVFLCTSALICAGLLLFAIQAPFVGLIVGFTLTGIGSGGLYPLKGKLLSDIYGVANVGRALGVIAPFTSFYGMAPTIGAWIRDRTGSYDAVFYAAAGLTVVSAPLLLLVRSRQTKAAERDSGEIAKAA